MNNSGEKEDTEISKNDEGLSVSCEKFATSYKSNMESKIYVCIECKVLFDSHDICAQHMSECHALHNFDFSYIEMMEKHTKTSRKIKPPLRYSDNQSTSVVSTKFQLPNESHPYRCPFCICRFDSLEVSVFHEGCHFEKKECGVSGSNPFVCRLCEGLSESKNDKVGNTNTTVNPKESDETRNSEVTYYFESWSKCSWHLWKSHQIDCELPRCLHVGCEFKSPFLHKVREHESVHLHIRDFRCDICHKTFKQLKQLRTHEKYHKIKNTNLPPPAESRWYTTQKCDICSRVLSDSKCLKKHIAVVHNKLKPHTCNVCGHQSARKAELQLHLRTHTREKPYKCSSCPYATGDHNSLRRHALTHSSKKKPYACPLCSFTCIQSAGFKKHVIAKHAEEDAMNSLFVCPYCPRISVSKSTHEYHLRDHDEGRIPIHDTQIPDGEKASGANKCPRSFLTMEDSSSNSNTGDIEFGSRNVTYWNQEDDSSVDMVVDTGGITIPANSQPTSLTFGIE